MFSFDTSISSAVEADAAKLQAAWKSNQRATLSAKLLDRMHHYWQAANYLTIGQIYLAGESAVARAAAAGTHQATFARPLGNFARLESDLHPFESADHRAGRERHLPCRARDTAGRR